MCMMFYICDDDGRERFLYTIEVYILIFIKTKEEKKQKLNT